MLEPGTKFGKWIGPQDVLVAVFFLICLLLSGLYGFRLHLAPVYSFSALLLLYGLALGLGVGYAAVGILLEKTRARGTLSWGTAASQYLSAYQLKASVWELLRSILIFHLLTILHTNLHQRIPLFNGQLYDSQFRAADTLMFFGTDPVEWLSHSAWWASSSVTLFFDDLYVSWYFVKLAGVAFLLMRADLKIVRAFAVAFTLMWILHIAQAIIAPSLGPVYLTPEWFAKLQFPLAQQLQQHVLNGYHDYLAHPENGRVLLYEGMSGFPSLHVGMVGLYALFLWEHYRVFSICMWIYTILIWIGSALTGWHYVVDGLAGILMAVLCWWLGRRLLKIAKPLVETTSHEQVEAKH